MAKGDSGRIVVELEPGFKRRLYSALAMDNLTLKDWLVDSATQYLAERDQPALPDFPPRDRAKAKRT
jgi:hypothetical protein